MNDVLKRKLMYNFDMKKMRGKNIVSDDTCQILRPSGLTSG